jgi:hypothetical protein
MSSSEGYKIGSEIISRYEEALMQELPALYPDEGEREIVEQVLVPQFRALVMGVLEEFAGERKYGDVVLPAELPVLCGKVIDVISENKVLLDIDGLFKTVFERIQEVRKEVVKELEEDFLQKCRDILAEKGVEDRFTFLRKGNKWYVTEDFAPIGKGAAFASKILGRPIYLINITILEEIANRLFREVTGTELLHKYRQVLAEKGVTDRLSLLEKGVNWFTDESFEPFRKGRAFAVRILGRSTGIISISILKEIADKLFPEVSEEDLLDKCRQILSEKGIHDRFSLMGKTIRWFRNEDFGSFGKWQKFTQKILGRNVKRMTFSILKEIADKLYSVDDISLVDKYRQILAEKGVHDRFDLLGKGVMWFGKKTFEPFGKGKKFAKCILGRTVECISSSIIEEIADKLFPEVSDHDLLDKCRKILHEKGVNSREELLGKKISWFIGESFDSFGKGVAFAQKILGRSIEYVTIPILKEIADKLFPED